MGGREGGSEEGVRWEGRREEGERERLRKSLSDLSLDPTFFPGSLCSTRLVRISIISAC